MCGNVESVCLTSVCPPLGLLKAGMYVLPFQINCKTSVLFIRYLSIGAMGEVRDNSHIMTKIKMVMPQMTNHMMKSLATKQRQYIFCLAL